MPDSLPCPWSDTTWEEGRILQRRAAACTGSSKFIGSRRTCRRAVELRGADLFDPQRALGYAARLAVPRQPGSESEHRTGEQIASLLEGWGYRLQRQDFAYLDSLPGFLKAEILIGQALILGILWLSGNGPQVGLALAFLLAAWIALTGWTNNAVLDRSLEINFDERAPRWKGFLRPRGKRLQSTNYVAFLDPAHFEAVNPWFLEFIDSGARKTTTDQANGSGSQSHLRDGQGAKERADSQTQKPVLLLVAHYDSKSQRIPIVARIGLVSLAMGGGLLLTCLVLLSLAFPKTGVLIAPVGLLTVAAGIPLLFLGEGNRSPGAIDNASGAGLVLHLAEVYAQSAELQDNVDLGCIFTGAEEAGCLGARAFIWQHGDALRWMADRSKLKILNIDGIGVDGTLRLIGGQSKVGNARMSEQLARSSQVLDIPVGRFGLPGALYDHIPFSRAGLEAGTIIATSQASLAVHTARDEVEQLSVEGFRRAGELILEFVKGF